ncbi:MAG: T9SS type A sorting domain-containing protein [Bacteroidota bacterium]
MLQLRFIIYNCLFFLPCISMGQTLLRDTLTIGDQDRTYVSYVPQSYTPAEKCPVVMVLHGGGNANGEDLIDRMHFDEVADTAHFICLYPNGIANQWADGRGATTPDVLGVDDVAFLTALIDSFANVINLDYENIFVTGASNGGMMTQRLACETRGLFSAFASMIASMPKPLLRTCNPESEVPMLIMNGTEDRLVPYNGGTLPPFTSGGAVLSTDQTIEYWRQVNQCSDTFQAVEVADKDITDGSTVHLTTWIDCTESSSVRLYRVEGGGHTVPGQFTASNPSLVVGYTNQDIDAAIEIWNFFKAHMQGLTISADLIQAPNISVYPNPTSSSITIAGDFLAPVAEVLILDTCGKSLIKSNSYRNIDISMLKAGIYVVQIKVGSQFYYKKIVIAQ